MLRVHKTITFVCLIILCSNNYNAFGQIWLDDKVIFSEAEGYMEGEEYDEAIPLYQLLEKKGISNANISYKLGTCYLNIEGKKDLSIQHLEKSIKNTSSTHKGSFYDTTAPLKAYLSLGIAYRINNNLKKSAETLLILKDSAKGTDLEIIADYYLNQVQIAEFFTSNPLKNKLIKLKNNNKYSISNPLVLSDSIIFFMEERPFYNAVTTGLILNDTIFQFENLTPSIGADDNISLVSISPNGKRLIFTAYIVGKGYELFYSDKDSGNNWNSYIAFPEPINTPGNEAFASVTASGKEMFFSSNRHGGYGGSDIYYTKLISDNKWSTPTNLGPQINTPLNEVVCAISSDEESLFLSSEGHLNMGGFDLFYAKHDSVGNWTSPVNFGSPISTTDDDNFLSVSSKNKLYTRKLNANEAKQELYLIDINIESLQKKVLIKTQLSFNNKITPKAVSYNIKSENNEIIVSSLTSNTGSTQTFLGLGSYEYNFIYDDNTRAKQKVVITNNISTDELTLAAPDWEITPLVTHKKILILKDILFAFNSYQVLNSYYDMLDSVAILLKLEEVSKIIIEGHTDAKGSKEYNYALSQKRANAVAQYILRKGVDENKVIVQGKGENTPIAINNNPDGTDSSLGRRYNRRVSIFIKTNSKEIIIQKTNSIPKQLIIE